MSELSSKMGNCLALLHSNDIVHGDLTSSNFMLHINGSVYMIDFGLSFMSTLCEDKAVDLYVLERAFLSLHPNSEEFFAKVIAVYFEHVKDSKQIGARLEKVRRRGRKRTAFG